MLFVATLLLVTLSIAGSAAFFSIYGLAQIFTGSFWPVVVMASSLEAGKLTAASFVYRYWDKTTAVMKTYLITAILVLMVITSAGIFGFLSAAYQEDILPIKQNEQQIALLEQEKAELQQLKDERLERKKQIDADIASLKNTFVTGRQRLMESYGPELEQLKQDINDYTKQIRQNTLQISKLKSQNLEQEAHTGPIIFIAKVFDKDVDDTTKWLILMIIFAFDPLAVVLTIGTNMVVLEEKKTRKEKNQPLVQRNLEDHADNSEPDPSITSISQLLKQPEHEIDYDDIQTLLENLNNKNKELTPEEIKTQEQLQSLVRRKEIKDGVRTSDEE